MTPEGTCNLPNILSGSSTGTGARTETGELGGKRTLYFLQCEPSNNGKRAHLPGMGTLSLCKDFLDIVGFFVTCSSYLSTTATPPLMEIKALANPVTASSRRGWLPLYLMSFISIFLMQMLNGIYLHFSVKRVSLIGLVTLYKSLTHFLSVILWHCWHSTLCLTHFILWHSVALFGIPWHY